jgi:acid phosphatase type 7
MISWSMGWRLFADNIALVRVGEEWAFFKGTQAPLATSNTWQQVEFDDSAWLRAISGIGNIQVQNATFLTDMPGSYTSVFFRRKFHVQDPSQVIWLTLRMDYSDGFVAYLNGREIARRGLDGATHEAVPFDALAQPHAVGAPEDIDVSAFIPFLRSGDNTLAIQGHSAGLWDYDFCMVPELFAQFTRGPFLQNATSNSIQIIWKTMVPADTVVEYGIPFGTTRYYADPKLVTLHVATLTNLAPATGYAYRALSSAGTNAARSDAAAFRTLKTAGAFSFLVVGDTGWGSAGQHQIASAMARSGADLVVVVGDVMYPAFTLEELDTKCLSVYHDQLRTTPFFFLLGNHDRFASPTAFLEAFYLPTNSATGTEHFYSFDHGDAHFVMLHTDVGISGGADYSPGSLQYQWLAADLAATCKPWKFLFFHNPIRSSGPHQRDDANANGIYDQIDLQNTIGKLAAQYNVQVIFNGHDHDYEKLNPAYGTHTIVTAGGGAILYAFSGRNPASSRFDSRYNFVKVKVEGDALAMEAIGAAGEVFDTMYIQRAAPLVAEYQATWHSPMVEAIPGGDSINLTGQNFDFIGTPMPAVAGRFSNLGRFYVNHDQDTLYLGIEQAMLYDDSSLFVFLETPALPGVTNLSHLGNSQVDPEGQGVDGLDFLKNLGFTNFTPAIGLILGDESADGQHRSFLRAGGQLNTGQGAFRLDANFSSIPNVRLQQYNRSPQPVEYKEERNANFIEIALPWRELGSLAPGDPIKIGAVVGLSGINTNVMQAARELDSGFLGQGLVGSGLGPVWLEGLTVHLAKDPDPDKDGLLTEIELTLGTNPNDPDTDHDGLPDGWEVRFGLSPLKTDGNEGAQGDPDHDGLTNLQEYLAGTDPGDIKSTLSLKLVKLTQAEVTLAWPSVPNKQYQVEFADALPSAFRPLPGWPGPILATNYETKISDSVPLIPWPARYYRVRVVP